jgi:hypothetical protein
LEPAAARALKLLFVPPPSGFALFPLVSSFQVNSLLHVD